MAAARRSFTLQFHRRSSRALLHARLAATNQDALVRARVTEVRLCIGLCDLPFEGDGLVAEASTVLLRNRITAWHHASELQVLPDDEAPPDRQPRCVRVEWPDGRLSFFEGEMGAERLVRVERPDGATQFYEGARGAERVVREVSWVMSLFV